MVTKTNIHVYTTENGLASNSVAFLHTVSKEHLLVSSEKSAQVFNTRDGKFNSVPSIIDPPFYSVVANSYPPLVIGAKKMATFDSVTLQFKDPAQFRAPFIFSPYCITSDRQGNFFLSDEHNLYKNKKREEEKSRRVNNICFPHLRYALRSRVASTEMCNVKCKDVGKKETHAVYIVCKMEAIEYKSILRST